jgi:hypothetical protein
MLYLLDANTLITAKNDYYQMERVPEFWDWLLHHAEQGSVKIPPEIFNEIRKGTDDLADWVKQTHVESALVLPEEVDPGMLQQILDEGYASDLTDVELEKIGMDPFLIAYALPDRSNRMVISGEVRSPKKQRANRKVPDVCKSLGISCKNIFTLVTDLNFSTTWNADF